MTIKYLKFPNAENIDFEPKDKWGSTLSAENWEVKLNFTKQNESRDDEGNFIPTTYNYRYVDFFSEVISLSDFFTACKESIDNKATEIQEIWVWDKIQKEYIQVNFDKLILESNKLDERISAKYEEGKTPNEETPNEETPNENSGWW